MLAFEKDVGAGRGLKNGQRSKIGPWQRRLTTSRPATTAREGWRAASIKRAIDVQHVYPASVVKDLESHSRARDVAEYGRVGRVDEKVDVVCSRLQHVALPRRHRGLRAE